MSWGLFILVCLAGGLRAQVMQGDGYTWYRQVGKSYKIYATPQPWSAASRTCRAEGARLAVPRNCAEADIVGNLFRQLSPASLQLAGSAHPNHTLIGFSSAYVEGVFMTDNGETLETYYAAWADGEPGARGSRGCGALLRGGGLGALSCAAPAAFACEKGSRVIITAHSPRTMSSDAEYAYDSGARLFYKFHAEQKSWASAAMACRAEGAELAFPVSVAELAAIRAIYRNVSNHIILLGFSDAHVEGEYLDPTGKPLTTKVVKWSPGQPDDWKGDEDCGSLFSNMLLNDVSCSVPAAFICQKSRSNTPVASLYLDADSDYAYYPDAGVYYKFHSSPRTWFDAVLTCKKERATLAMPSSDRQAEVLRHIMAGFPAYSLPQVSSGDYVLLGFSDTILGGHYTTEDGNSIDSMFHTWQAGQPDNWGGREHCGSMHRGGGLNDLSCETPNAFICQKSSLSSTSSRLLQVDSGSCKFV